MKHLFLKLTTAIIIISVIVIILTLKSPSSKQQFETCLQSNFDNITKEKHSYEELENFYYNTLFCLREHGFPVVTIEEKNKKLFENDFRIGYKDGL
ncbi:MAG: hypothetical protein AAB849_01945 [Patescibacteria group bacterium]